MYSRNLFKHPFLIAGPCALETEVMALEIAASVKSIGETLEIPVIFKGSYTKANRTCENSFHGVGIKRGLEWLSAVKEKYNIMVTSDVHDAYEVDAAAEVLDIIQIPALLCKNTRLLHAVGDTSIPVNIKKGHFLTASDLGHSVEKIVSRGNNRILLTERGSLFGYGDIIVDFRSIDTLRSFGYPVIFDVTHSVRITSRRSEESAGGTPEAIPLLTRCAAAAGVDGLFIEAHSSPPTAKCDAVVSYPLKKLGELVKSFCDLHTYMRQKYNLKQSQGNEVLNTKSSFSPAKSCRD
jgi:2-dehydro-3-deoxyphosphooctonate aldolase (KDO 8-P synthase)